MRIRASWLSAMLFWSAAAASAPTANDLASYKEAGKRFVSLVASAEAGAKMQQLRTPEFASLVRTLSDGDRMLSGAAHKAGELNTILDICDVANKASVSLMLFDLKAHIDPKGTPQEIAAAMVPLMTSNNLAFQDELMKLQPFLLRCLAEEVAPITEFTLALKPEELTDVRRKGLARTRAGLLQIYTAALRVATDTQFREDYRVALLSVMAETAGAFVSITQLSDRRRIADALGSAAQTSVAPYRVHLAKIADAFRDVRCRGLCGIE